MRTRDWRTSLAVLAALSLTSISGITLATDFRLTGFGTLGYAQSTTSDARYLRYINDSGTFKADSLVGIQAEAQFNAQWGSTVQAVASAPRTRDEGTEAKIRWGFVSFRPDNDWLIRVGRVRPPFFFNTQNAEVGVTYDQARLPAEVYSLSPVYDFDGAAITKSWSTEISELSIDAYWGKSDIMLRLFDRDSNQPVFYPSKVTAKGLVLSHVSGPLFLRGGIHHATGEFVDPQPPETYTPITPFSPVPPPLGGTLYVPSNFLSEVSVTVLTAGVDWRSGDWRLTAEYGQRIVTDTKVGLDSKGAYATLAHSIGKWTPYVTYARILSGSDPRTIYQAVDSTPVPLLAQGPPLSLPANFHRILADRGFVFDQYSTMLGTSYGFSATSKLKIEWMRTKIGLGSSLADGEARNSSLNVFSVSYSAAF